MILHLCLKFQPYSKLIRLVPRMLGFGDDEINRLLYYLYSALANEIQQPENTHAKDNNTT